MSTILESSLNLIGASIAGGLPWDLIKLGSSKIVNSFKSKFIKKYDVDENVCMKFLEDIATSKSINPKKPFKEAIIVFEKYYDKECPDSFQIDFEEWLKENSDEFENLSKKEPHQVASITINGNQFANRGGKIEIIGNQYNTILGSNK